MLPKLSRQLIRLLVFLLALQCFFAATAFASRDSWITLQTSRFGIVSQLSERETRLWAEEFDKFVVAMHQLYGTDERNLIPLTIILFRNRRAFSPYVNASDFKMAGTVAGLFANRDDWSVIALPGLRDYEKTRRVILHEAVHWYLKSQKFDPPLWLEEGLAEVFSTFEIHRGKGRWGLPIQSHVNYLNIRSLQPTRDFLRANLDDAVDVLDTWYPQAWAMVHYFMFGNNGGNRKKFSVFLTELGKSTTERAFQTAFGLTYEEFDRELNRYVRNGKYGIGEIELNDTDIEMNVNPASEAMVQFALGRLAVGVDKTDKGIEHAEAVISVMPSRPEGYELLAMASVHPDNRAKQLEALEKAISLNTDSSQIYYMQASLTREKKWKSGSMLHEILDRDIARYVADMYKKSILLRPNKKHAFEGFAVTLLNLNEYEEEDRKILEIGRLLYPGEGSVPVGFAALAKADNDIESFNRYLEEAFTRPMRLHIDLRRDLRGAQQSIYHEWLFSQLQPLMIEGRFEEAEAFFDHQKKLYTSSGDLQKVLNNIDVILYSSKNLHKAELAVKAFQFDEAESILRDIENNDKIAWQVKNVARRMLSHIEKIRQSP